ncbi:MAG: acyltransferase [Muribaculaceae bacterium]|nr:acyltransferase [Muribaculaceae bacterium]
MKSLQSLRGIFALFIFLHHLNLFDAGGDAGVCFFLILSGFVMSAGYWDKFSSHEIGYMSFMRKRLYRLYPYHIIGFVAALVLLRPFYGAVTPLVYASNLMMLQSWIPDRTFYFSCDAPSWCLSDFLFCYAMFPVIVKMVSHLSSFRLFFTACVILSGYIVAINLIPCELQVPLIYINPLFRLIDFTAGMALWRLVVSYPGNRLAAYMSGMTSVSQSIVEIVTVAVFASYICIYPFVSPIYGMASFWWIPVLMLILVFSAIDGRKGIVSRVISSRLLLCFGDLSFAFYMLHVPVIGGYRRLAHHFAALPEYNSVAAVILIFSVTLLLSVFVYEKEIPYLLSVIRRKRVG